MTLFLVDISRYQAGLSIAEVKKEGFSAVLARSTNGTVHDATFASFKSQAKKAGILFGAYHFLQPSHVVSIDAQANACAAAIGDTSITVMVDHEPDGTGAPIPSMADKTAFAQGLRGKGYTVNKHYLPHWVWQSMGSPGFADESMHLVSSSYVSGTGAASALYPGKGGAGWASYGGKKPTVWQFTDQAKVGGKLIDANAFEGTLAEMTTLFTAAKPAPTPTPEDDMDQATFNKLMDGYLESRGVFGEVTDTSGKRATRTTKWMLSSIHGLLMNWWHNAGSPADPGPKK